MSHAATKWAFDQPERFRDMKPSEWAVLLVLADCHNPVHGCFPSQDYICSKTNLAERAVRDHLNRLRERGLINWDSARESGRRGANRYRLGCEDNFQPAACAGAAGETGRDQPAESAGSSTGEIEQVQPADSDSFNRQNLPPNLVREPVTEPVEREARGRAGLPDGDDRGSEATPATATDAQPGPRLETFRRNWPTTPADDLAKVRAAWEALSPEDHAEACRRIEDFGAFLKSLGRKNWPSGATYLRERRWETLAVPAAADTPAEPARTVLRPWTKAWWAGWLAEIDAGDIDAARRRLSLARAGHGVTLRDGEAAPADGHLQQLSTSHPGWREWQDWLVWKGLSLPGFKGGDFWVWVPSPHPPDLPPRLSEEELAAKLAAIQQGGQGRR